MKHKRNKWVLTKVLFTLFLQFIKDVWRDPKFRIEIYEEPYFTSIEVGYRNEGELREK